jgi:hypothetical protein
MKARFLDTLGRASGSPPVEVDFLSLAMRAASQPEEVVFEVVQGPPSAIGNRYTAETYLEEFLPHGVEVFHKLAALDDELCDASLDGVDLPDDGRPEVATRDEMKRSSWVMVLNDDDTFTGLDGCWFAATPPSIVRQLDEGQIAVREVPGRHFEMQPLLEWAIDQGYFDNTEL